MRLYTELSSSDYDGTRRPSPMLNVAKSTDFQRRTSSDALSASSPENSTTFFPNLLFPLNRRAPLRRHKKDLTVYRSINALAETINGLYKAEVIHRRGPWRSFEAVEFATLEWVDWFNNRRLLEPIGNIPPAEAEERHYAMLEQSDMAA